TDVALCILYAMSYENTSCVWRSAIYKSLSVRVIRQYASLACPSVLNPSIRMGFFPSFSTVMDLTCPQSYRHYTFMRELSQDTPTLFDAPPPRTISHAKDFVRWCCSFGSDFRNSPDVANLRYWARKNKVKIIESDEVEILEAARIAL